MPRLNPFSLRALTFVLAPLPNAIFSQGSDEFSATSYESSAGVDFGRFLTSIIVVTGFALPIVLARSGIIVPWACAMSITGGAYVSSIAFDGATKQVGLTAKRNRMVYGTILAYS